MPDYKKWISSDFEKELVSVVIPTYNRDLLLKEALESVLSQSYRPIECIVVDDGSTDSTENLLNDLNSKITEDEITIIYLQQQNMGAQVARNTGTLASRGEYIQYLDSDDLLFPDKIKTQVEYLKRNEDCDGVFGNWKAGDSFKNVIVTAYAKSDMLDQMLTERCIHTLSFLMRRRLVQQIGPWDISLKRNQEIDYHLRGVMLDSVYQYVAIETGLHRHHDGVQITTSTGNSEILDFYEKWLGLLEKHNRLTHSIQLKVANLCIWYFLQDPRPNRVSVRLLSNAWHLDPNHSIFSSKKLHFLVKFIGVPSALKLWIRYMGKHRRINNYERQSE